MMTDLKGKKVLLAENPLLPMKVKSEISSLLFEEFKVESIVWVDSSFLSLMAFGRDSGLVIDFHYHDLTLVPVIHGRPHLSRMMVLPLGTKNIKNQSALFGDNEDDVSLVKAILKIAKNSHVDVRKPLLQNIVLVGGFAASPGLIQNLQSTLNNTLKDFNLNVNATNFQRIACAWVGGKFFSLN
jgi:actin-related protein